MDIKEIKEKKRQLEENIAELINKFEAETGTDIPELILTKPFTKYGKNGTTIKYKHVYFDLMIK
jgi:hypothetical protein